MATAKRPRPKRYRSAAQELMGYFAGELKPEVWDQTPFCLQQVEPSIARARIAVSAPFPDLMHRPASKADAHAEIQKCVEWAEQLAGAFNDDPKSTLPFGVQCHLKSVPGAKWASEFIGVLPSHLVHQVKPYFYRCFIKRHREEPDHVKGYRTDPLGYWNQITNELFWQHRADRAACRRILIWVEGALSEFKQEELPAIKYLKALQGDVHIFEVNICGVLISVKLQDNLVKFLWKLWRGERTALEHRTFKQRLIDEIPWLGKWLEPVEPTKGQKKAVTGSIYLLNKRLQRNIDFSGYRPPEA